MGPRPLRFHGTLLARLLALAAEHDVPYRPIQANQADVPRASVPAVPTNAKCPLVPSRAHQSGRRPGPVRFFPFACAHRMLHRMLHGALFKRACCPRPVSSAEARDPVSPLPHVDRRHADPLLRRQIRALSPRQPRPAKTVIQEYSAYSAGACVGVLGLRAETFAPYTAAAASAKVNGASERAHVCRRAASRLCSDGRACFALLWFAPTLQLFVFGGLLGGRWFGVNVVRCLLRAQNFQGLCVIIAVSLEFVAMVWCGPRPLILTLRVLDPGVYLGASLDLDRPRVPYQECAGVPTG